MKQSQRVRHPSASSSERAVDYDSNCARLNMTQLGMQKNQQVAHQTKHKDITVNSSRVIYK